MHVNIKLFLLHTVGNVIKDLTVFSGWALPVSDLCIFLSHSPFVLIDFCNWETVCLFIRGLFSDAVSSSDCTVLDDE
jgi:hypothetical protein